MMQPATFDPTSLRVGQGYDVHAFAEGRKLILGGVNVPHVRGLLGHSDADVLAHAVADALLGGIRGGDIGKLFPDTDPAYAGAELAQAAGSLWRGRCAPKAFRYSTWIPSLPPRLPSLRRIVRPCARTLRALWALRWKTWA